MIKLVFAAFLVALSEKLPIEEVIKKEVDTGKKLSVDADLLVIEFCGNAIPLAEIRAARHYQEIIRKYDRHGIRRLAAAANRKMPVVESILNHYGIPQDFKYVPLLESGMQAHPVSHRGAAGYWQLMPSTARSLGLTVNRTRDDRKDLIKSTHAAGKYLRQLYREFGSWTLVAMAFNTGPGLVKDKMARSRSGHGASLKTTRYIYQLIAVKEWICNPARGHEWKSGAIVDRLIEKKAEQRKAALAMNALKLNTQFLSLYLASGENQKIPYSRVR